MRTARLLDSALTGSLGGPIIVFFRDTLARMGYASPSRSVLRAGLTCAVITSSLQLVVNQTRITRVRYLARKEGSTSPPKPVDPSEAVEASTTAQIRTALENPVKGPDGEVLGEKSLPARIMSTMSTFLPIRKISDEEYLSALERRRQAMDERIAEIESEEGRMYDAMTRDAKS